jgi:uncharacterized membrane protein YfcA
MTELLAAWPIFLALMATGVVAGILAGLLGVGGGIVIVPVLFFLLQSFSVSADSAMLIATATSLATIVPTAISSVRAHYAKGNVDMAIVRWWSSFILMAAVLGSLLATNVAGAALTLMFAFIAIAVSLNMLFRAGAPALFAQLPGRFGQSVMALSVGLFSVMIGIGGGTLGVPMLNSCNVSAHRAVATAAVFGLLIAVPGVLTLLLIGERPIDAPLGNIGLINLPAFVAIVPLTVLFAPIGARLGAALDQVQLKRVFALALMLTGARMLYQSL